MSTTPTIAPNPTTTSGYVQVLADCVGIDGLLTYAIPTGMTIHLGDILTVPLGNRYVGAVALELATAIEPEPGHYDQAGLWRGQFRCVAAVVLGIDRQNRRLLPHPLIQTAKAALPPKLLDRSSYRVRLKLMGRSDDANLSAAARELDFLQAHAASKNA
jgi:primosomal protein N' (replication factor Y)